MKSTGILKEERGGVNIMLGILGKVCDRLGSERAVPAGDLDRILEFLKVFVDRCHHAKEEDSLFPRWSGLEYRGKEARSRLCSTST